MKNRLWLGSAGLILVGIMIFSNGCATPQGVAGAGLGAVVGGVSGALIDRGNPGRGAAIGGGLGAVLGGGLGDIAGSSQGYAPLPVRAITRRPTRAPIPPLLHTTAVIIIRPRGQGTTLRPRDIIITARRS